MVVGKKIEMFSLKGKLIYDPERLGLKRIDQSHTLILDVETEDLVQYYQWLLKKKYGNWLNLQPPMFGTHITVVRPQEVDVNHHSWLKYQEQFVTVNYSSEIERHWEFWSLNIYSKKLVDIRRELGLRTDFRLHMTIGRQFDWQPKEIIKEIVQDTDYLSFEPNS